MSFNLVVTGPSNRQAEVDVNNNLQATGPLTEAFAGFAALTAENDAGTVTGSRYNKAVEVSDDFRVRTGQDNMVFNEIFPGSALNTAVWQNALTTMTTTVASGFAQLNAGLSVAINAVAQLRSYRHIPCYKQYTTYFEMEVQLTQAPVTGNRCEWGAVLMSGTSAPTDGAFFRITEGGEFRCVLNYNGTETQSANLIANLPAVGTTNSYLIYIGTSQAEFWVNNILFAEIPTPAGQGAALVSMNVPIAFRNFNVAATSVAQVMKVGAVNATFGDQGMSKPWGHVLAGSGAMAAQGQTGGTMGSTAIYTNAAAAAAAALSNTTAAAANVGLGGIVNILPTLTAGTDGIITSYQVPLGTAAVPGKSLYITGIRLDSVITTALTGGPVIYAYSLAFGSTNVSLATTEAATAKAPRRLPLGIQSYVAAAAVGAVAPVIQDDWTCSPIVVHPGEFIQIVARNLGTVTTLGAVTVVAALTGYWE